MSVKVAQLLPSLQIGDAVGNDVRALKDLIARMGYNSEIYAEGIDSRLPEGTAKPASAMNLHSDDVLIYHLSVGSPLFEKIQKLSCRKMMIYHNITPSAFFKPYSKEFYTACEEGLRQMREMKDTFSYCMADSAFNRQNLIDAGYTCPIDVRPILIPFEDYAKTPDAATVEQYSDGWTNILFVGRIVPNKKQEDVIRAFACYKKTVNPKSRLILVGNADRMDVYLRRLQDYIRMLGVEDVIFPGHISFPQILAFYKTASVFLCESEHEGFCVPLLEAMCFDVPVVAYDACAVPGTLGGSGILLEEKDPMLTAAVIDRLVSDPSLRQQVIAGQQKRLAEFSYENVSALFGKQFATFMGRS